MNLRPQLQRGRIDAVAHDGEQHQRIPEIHVEMHEPPDFAMGGGHHHAGEGKQEAERLRRHGAFAEQDEGSREDE